MVTSPRGLARRRATSWPSWRRQVQDLPRRLVTDKLRRDAAGAPRLESVSHRPPPAPRRAPSPDAEPGSRGLARRDLCLTPRTEPARRWRRSLPAHHQLDNARGLPRTRGDRPYSSSSGSAGVIGFPAPANHVLEACRDGFDQACAFPPVASGGSDVVPGFWRARRLRTDRASFSMFSCRRCLAVATAVARFVDDYNHRRLHEALDNVTPADAYEGRRTAIVIRREQIKRRTLQRRKRENLHTPPKAANRQKVSLTKQAHWSRLV